MSKMLPIIALTAIISLSVATTLASAQGESPKTLTCKDFVLMDMTNMKMSVVEMQKASGSANVVLDDAAQQEKVATTLEGCNGNPNKLAMDAMRSKK